MLVKIENVFEIKKRGFVVVIHVEKLPKIGDFLGTHKIIGVDKFHVSCYGGKEKTGYMVAVLLKDSPVVGEELELSE